MGNRPVDAQAKMHNHLEDVIQYGGEGGKGGVGFGHWQQPDEALEGALHSPDVNPDSACKVSGRVQKHKADQEAALDLYEPPPPPPPPFPLSSPHL